MDHRGNTFTPAQILGIVLALGGVTLINCR